MTPGLESPHTNCMEALDARPRPSHSAAETSAARASPRFPAGSDIGSARSSSTVASSTFNAFSVAFAYGRDAEFFFHLSPGTPPMAVIWILVGTTERAELLQSSKERGVQTVRVPFQIAAEFIPAMVQRADTDLERSLEYDPAEERH